MGWQAIIDWLASHGVRIALIALGSWALYRLVKRFLPPIVRRVVARGMPKEPEEAEKRAITLAKIFVTTWLVLIIVVAAFTILSELGINITTALAGLGIAGVAIGFGAQSLVRDFIGGVIILLENHYRIGDVVRIADISGLVEDIDLRKTVLRDLDGIVHIIPNGEIRVSSNLSKTFSRVNMNISVGYGEDLDHVIEIINRVGRELAEDPQWKDLILKPPQVLGVDAFEESGISIKILGDTKPIHQWNVMRELRLRLKRAFDKEGIEIPWPHVKVYFGGPPPPQG
ncbi:MAG: mechanosensitive ion channel family protein [Candidatus Acetothermia bacterium]|jgi:small conductance mechanosensitive channel|nr:mechanosensitive ion channel family protein [Candidatus Acetothermia bacterium]MDH7505889.1 mechanosensitive ion channel family protein [Candidatus Acetothermia bacterium]